MNKVIFAVLFIVLLAFGGCHGSDGVEPIPITEPVSIEAVHPTPTDEPAEPTERTEPIEPTELTEDILSISEAQELLHERFLQQGIITYIPDMNKLEEGVQLYAFSVDYSSLIENHSPNAFLYAWVNSVTGLMNLEEPSLYSNIPDSMFPVPMRDGEVIPYDSFVPPDYAWGTGYAYADTSIMEVYQEQLRDAGFIDHGNVMSVDSLWRYDRSSDGAVLFVELYNDGERFAISMAINYL